jgi:hypothetical protein
LTTTATSLFLINLKSCSPSFPLFIISICYLNVSFCILFESRLVLRPRHILIKFSETFCTQLN